LIDLMRIAQRSSAGLRPFRKQSTVHNCDTHEVKKMAVPNLWRTKKQRYSLHGEVCVHCARAVFPPREICPHCHKPMQSDAPAAPVAFAFPTMAAPVPSLPVAVVGDD
jgi:hypothetical protein